jgi:hypothetical protein
MIVPCGRMINKRKKDSNNKYLEIVRNFYVPGGKPGFFRIAP